MTASPYQCGTCQQCFPVPSLARDHVAKEHPEEVRPDDNDQPHNAGPGRA